MMEFLVNHISNEGILKMALLADQIGTLCLDTDVLVWRGDSIPLLDKDGRVLANKGQVLQHTTLLFGMEAHVCRRLVSEPSRLVGQVESDIQGDTGVAVAVLLCRPGAGRRVLMRCINRPAPGTLGLEPDRIFLASR